MDGFSLPFVILLYYPEAVIIPPMPVFHLKKLRFFALQHNCRCIASRLFLIQPAAFPIRQETREYDGGTECGWYIMGMSLSHRRNVRLAYVILRGSRCAVEAVGFVTV